MAGYGRLGQVHEPVRRGTSGYSSIFGRAADARRASGRSTFRGVGESPAADIWFTFVVTPTLDRTRGSGAAAAAARICRRRSGFRYRRGSRLVGMAMVLAPP